MPDRSPKSTRRDLNKLLQSVVEAEQELLDVIERFERADRPKRTASRTPADIIANARQS
jgi:hypothetical protein